MTPRQSHRGDSNRPRRVGEVLRRALADILRQEFDHPQASIVTLTAVDVSPDLRNARVYFTLLGKDVNAASVTADLNKASGYFRHCLSNRVELRGLPRLTFEYDKSVEQGSHMEALFDQIHKKTDSE